MGFVVGVDLGGTATKIAVLNEQGEIRASTQIKTRTEDGGKHILGDIASAVRAVLNEEAIELDELVGIGVGVPGPVMDGRTVTSCVNLGWGETDVASFLERELGCKCRIGNDANVAALGGLEGASRDTHSSVMITSVLGGRGVIVNDRIITGFHGGGGEVGPFPHSPGFKAGCAARSPVLPGGVHVRQRCGRGLFSCTGKNMSVKRSLTRRKTVNLRPWPWWITCSGSWVKPAPLSPALLIRKSL